MNAIGKKRQTVESEARTWFELGESYRGLGWFEQAVESYQQALRVEPGHREAWLKIAVVHERAGESRRSVAVLEQAVRQNPSDAPLWHALGVYYDRYDKKYGYHKVREVHRVLRDLDPELAQRFFEQFVQRIYTQSTF
ncbi:MAG: tetratricopeptide repeat protein [Burkholderiales bacterium]